MAYPALARSRNGTSPSTILSLRYTKKNITEYCLLRLTPPLWVAYLRTERTFPPIQIPYWSLLSRAYPIISGHMHCDIAFYCSPAVLLNQLNTLSEGLLQAKGTMSRRQAGIFSTGTADSQPHFARYADNLQIRRWENLLAEGDGQTVCRGSISFLMTPSKKQVKPQISPYLLGSIPADYTQRVKYSGKGATKILPLLERGGRPVPLPEMREVVKETTHYFQSEEGSCGNENAVERAKIYLENHIDQPFVRRCGLLHCL